MNNIIIGIITLAVLVLFFFSLIIGVNKTERAEGYAWQKQADGNKLFYLTEWQAKQCKRWDIEIIK